MQDSIELIEGAKRETHPFCPNVCRRIRFFELALVVDDARRYYCATCIADIGTHECCLLGNCPI